MTEATRQRLFGYQEALAHPVTAWITVALLVLLIVTPLVVIALVRGGVVDEQLRRELRARYLTWLALVPLMLLPVLAGAASTMAAVTLLSLICYYEFARNTLLAREYAINCVVVLGIVAVNFGAADHWWEFFSATTPLTIVLIAVVAVLGDRPQNYLQRVALGSLGFVLLGAGLAHLSYLANGPGYRPLLLMIVLCVELNDVFAFICGKSFGRRKLAPNTSPGKTIGGAVGALVLTSLLVMLIGLAVFHDSELHWAWLLVLGALISGLGQLGDLMMSAIKRDLGVKDMGAALPGHGGFLDRFDSLILVSPAVFYFVAYFVGLGSHEPLRIFTG